MTVAAPDDRIRPRRDGEDPVRVLVVDNYD